MCLTYVYINSEFWIGFNNNNNNNGDDEHLNANLDEEYNMDTNNNNSNNGEDGLYRFWYRRGGEKKIIQTGGWDEWWQEQMRTE